MSKKGACPYTRSGVWPDKELVDIMEGALKTPNPKCPTCGIEGVVKGFGEVAWCECPRCGQKIGDTMVM